MWDMTASGAPSTVIVGPLTTFSARHFEPRCSAGQGCAERIYYLLTVLRRALRHTSSGASGLSRTRLAYRRPLAMFGPNLQPDWLVSMDGTNDAAVTCYSSQG